jgi:hypothetical protein
MPVSYFVSVLQATPCSQLEPQSLSLGYRPGTGTSSTGVATWIELAETVFYRSLWCNNIM